MGYPAFHTRLVLGADWARVLWGEGKHWLWIFFVSSKHLSRRKWIALCPKPTLFYSTAQKIIFVKHFRSKLYQRCHAEPLLYKKVLLLKYISLAVCWCFTAVYEKTKQDVSRGVLGRASLRTIKPRWDQSLTSQPTEKLNNWQSCCSNCRKFQQAERKTMCSWTVVSCPLSDFEERSV